MERERRERKARELSERTRLKRATARHTMALWNTALAGWRTIFYPSVGTALSTGCNWLHVVCPPVSRWARSICAQLAFTPSASIGTVVRAMSCKRCSPHPPFARAIGATRRSWYGRDGWQRLRQGIPVEQFMADDERQRRHNYYMELEHGPTGRKTGSRRGTSATAPSNALLELGDDRFLCCPIGVEPTERDVAKQTVRCDVAVLDLGPVLRRSPLVDLVLPVWHL
jgi:hypothetical protein